MSPVLEAPSPEQMPPVRFGDLDLQDSAPSPLHVRTVRPAAADPTQPLGARVETGTVAGDAAPPSTAGSDLSMNDSADAEVSAGAEPIIEVSDSNPQNAGFD